MGRARHCRQISLCVGSTHCVQATLGLPLLTGVCAFPVYVAQAPCCSIWSGPCVACSSSFWVLHKSADSVGPVFCAFPGWSSSGSQELEGRTFPGCSVPSPLPGPSLSFCTHQSGASCVRSGELVSSRDSPRGCQPSRISGSLWLETGSLCSLVGLPSLGPCLPLSPPPCLLPPPGGGWAGLQPASSSLGSLSSSFVLQTGPQCVLAG